MGNLCFNVFGDMDQYGRLSHLAAFETAVDAVAYASTRAGGSVIPGVKVGMEIPGADVKRMDIEIGAARRAAGI